MLQFLIGLGIAGAVMVLVFGAIIVRLAGRDSATASAQAVEKRFYAETPVRSKPA